MNLLEIFKAAGDAKMSIMDRFMNPNGDGLYGKASQFVDSIDERKNEIFNPAESKLGALGFGQNDFTLREAGKIPQIQKLQAADTSKLMQNSLASIGANIPAAGMVSLGSMDLSTPDTTSPFISTPIEFDSASKRQAEELLLEEATQGSGMLNDPNQYTPTPEAGALDMRMA
jgi:hypothetical protein